MRGSGVNGSMRASGLSIDYFIKLGISTDFGTIYLIMVYF
jgi:hypothetical protein